MRPSIPPIKPCPFCGAARLDGSLFAHDACDNVPYRQAHEVEDPWEPTLAICSDGYGFYWVSCEGPRGVIDCCRGPRVKGPMTIQNKEKVGKACVKAVEVWNQRVSGQQMRMEV